MNKEIEEMAKIMCQDAGTKNCNIQCNAKPFCDVNFYAERLYKEGYRKQREGEWIKHPASYECTVCKEEFFVEGYAEDYDPITDWDLHFCPNCGAKIRKEDEGK
jgi:DNA-directed RNA polymerase subunit RPC12/RpoP